LFASKMILSAILSFSSLVPVAENIEISKQSKKLLQMIRLESGNTLTVKWNTVTQTPELLSGKLTKPSTHSPGWIAYAYLHKIKLLYGLNRVHEDLKILNIDKTDSLIRVYMQRQLFKKPVCGNQLLVELDHSGVIQRIEGTIHSGLEEKRLGRAMYAAVTPEKAKEIAFAYDESIRANKSLSVESCYLPTREGIPLVYVVTYEKEGRPVSIKIHSLTGRVIE